MILKTIPSELVAHLEKISVDGMDIFTLENQTIRGAVINASTLVNQARYNHELGILESMALGYAYIGTLLASQQLGGQDKLRLDYESNGAFKGFSVEATALGNVRGYLKDNVIEMTEAPQGLSLSPYIGEGSLSLTRMYEGAREPVTGTVELFYKDIALDLAYLYHQSEQTKTAFALGVSFNQQGFIDGAAGLFLQAMPDAHEIVLDDLTDWLPQLPSLAKSIAKGNTANNYIHEHFQAFDPRIIGSKPVQFSCQCSWHSFLKYLLSLGKEELTKIANQGDMPMKVVCHNCDSSYEYSDEDLAL